MSSSVLDSRALINHSSSGSSPLLWYEFEECENSPHGFVFSYLIKVFNLVVGFPTNVMVMWLVARKKSDSSTSDIFIFNLAISDAYFCLMTPIDLVNRLLLNNNNVWYFQRFAYGIKNTTPLFLTCICLDRYMAVVHSILFSNIKDNKIRIAISIVVWGLMLTGAFIMAFMGEESTINIFTVVVLGAFAIMVFCNISIIWTLRKSVMGKEKMHPVKKKAFRMVVMALAIIVFTYLPPVALFPFAEYFSVVDFKCNITEVVYAIISLSSSIEPLLYISKINHCLANMPCSCCKTRSNEPDNMST